MPGYTPTKYSTGKKGKNDTVIGLTLPWECLQVASVAI